MVQAHGGKLSTRTQSAPLLFPAPIFQVRRPPMSGRTPQTAASAERPIPPKKAASPNSSLPIPALPTSPPISSMTPASSTDLGSQSGSFSSRAIRPTPSFRARQPAPASPPKISVNRRNGATTCHPRSSEEKASIAVRPQARNGRPQKSRPPHCKGPAKPPIRRRPRRSSAPSPDDARRDGTVRSSSWSRRCRPRRTRSRGCR